MNAHNRNATAGDSGARQANSWQNELADDTSHPSNLQTLSFDEYLLAEIRCAALRAKILEAEINVIGLALEKQIITADQAIVLLHGVDLLRFIGQRADDE
jgi:hypothetical protein